MLLTRFSLPAVVLCLALAGCADSGTDLSVPALATVDGAPITRTMLAVYLQQQGIVDPTPEQSGEALQNLIQLFVVSNAAEDEAQFRTPETLAALELQQRRFLFERFAEDYVARYPSSDADLQRQYSDTIASAGNRQYRLESIRFPDEQQALTAILALQDEAVSFAELATEHGSETLDWINLIQIPGDYAAAVKALGTGEVAPIPLPSAQGWRLVRLLETREFTPPSFEQVKVGMRRDLDRQKVEAWMAKLQEHADVVLENVSVE